MNRPATEQVREALTLAMRAPSVRNSQPWSWRLGDQLHLEAGRDRQLRETDPGGAELLLSCGAVLHHLRIALAAIGWRTEVKRFPDQSKPTRLATIELCQGEPTAEETALAAAIPHRRSDSRPFDRKPVDLTPLTSSDDVVTVRIADDRVARPSLVSALAEAERWRTTEPALLLELFGAPAVPPLRVIDTEAGLLVLGTATDDAHARLRAGETASRILLTATRLGLSSCLLTVPLGIGATADVVGTKLLDGGCPQAVIRVGRPAPDVPPLPATPRRPLAEVVHLGG